MVSLMSAAFWKRGISPESRGLSPPLTSYFPFSSFGSCRQNSVVKPLPSLPVSDPDPVLPWRMVHA